MGDDIRKTFIGRVKPLFAQYDSYFQNFLSTGQKIDTGLQTNSEILNEIRHRFNNLSATVELVLEGVDVFDSEIKKTHELLKKSIDNFKDSVLISEKVSTDLNNIAGILKRIQDSVRKLADVIHNINFVSESIEVASRNAGITAFHAGREGRGFEVIAREMTGLVQNAQESTRLIPLISNELLKNIDELNQELKKIQDVTVSLREIADKFLNINKELLALVPYLENSIKEISNSVSIQKELYTNLRTESEKLSDYLEDTYHIMRITAITEMFLGAFFQHLNNTKNYLTNAEDEHNFYYIFHTLKNILDNEPKLKEEHERFFSGVLRKLEIHTSERLILQFVSESKHLNEVIGKISDKVKFWAKTHNFANETLMRAKVFYQDIGQLLTTLNAKSKVLKELISKVNRPVQELKMITERSRLLGLYAGIESARSGKYAEPLGVVTSEIKALSMRSSEFVGSIDSTVGEILKDINNLISCFIKTTEDVELGVDSLTLSMDAVSESSKVLDNLSALSQEMFASTTEMVNQCGMLGEHHRNFDAEYHKISESFLSYGTIIKSGEELTKEMKAIINEFKKDISIVTTRRKKIVLRTTENPITLDPASKTDSTSHQVIEQIFTGLYTFDQLNHLIPGVALSFAVSENGRVWDFNLKKGVKFHNGIEVQARDVVFSLSRVKKGPNKNFIEYLADMVIVDPYHIRFILKFPYVPFLANLACGVCDIVPYDFNPDKPVGCGPYRLVSYEKEKEIVLEAFDEFFDGRPPIDECVIKVIEDDREAVELFKKGEISLLSLTTDMLQEFSPDDIYTGPVLSTQYIAINFSKKTPFLDVNVRRAMNYAIDRNYYCHTLLKDMAMPAHGVYPPGIPGYNKNLIGYQYDIKKARELMRQAGFGGGIPEEFVLDVRAGVEIIKRAEFIKDSFAKIGIHLQINPLPWEEFLNKIYKGNSILSLRGWVSDNGDPDNFVHPLFHSKNFGASGNTSFYANEELDGMIETARAEQVPRRRLELYQKIESFIVENALWIFLSHGVDCYAVQKNIKGFTVDPFGLVRFRNLFCL